MEQTLDCLIEPHPSYRLKITGSTELLSVIATYMQTVRVDKFPQKRYGRVIWKQNYVTVSLVDYKPSLKQLTCDRGYFFFITQFLYNLKKQYPTAINYTVKMEYKGELELTEKWKEILREDQRHAFNEFTRLKGSLIQMPTGQGKTETFLAVCESYLEMFPYKNVLITVPKNAIGQEIEERLTKYGFDSKYGLREKDGRIKVINPMGYNRSKLSEDSQMNTWLSQVGLMITDEVHHVNALSYAKIFHKCVNLDYSYGFSATASKDRIHNVTEFKNWPYTVQQRVGMTGPSIICKFAKDYNKEIDYYVLNGEFGGPQKGEEANFLIAVRRVCFNPKFQSMVLNILNRFGERQFFIPIPIIDAGMSLHTYLTAHGIKALHWTGDYSLLPEGMESLEDVKRALNGDNGYRALIATSTASEGVDIGSLDAALICFGKNYKIVPQLAGRVGRRGKPLIINVINEEYGILKNQGRERHSHLKLNYNTQPKKLMI